MKKHDFQYFFHEGISNMFSHGFMSFATVGITIACLLIMGTFSLVSLNANANLQSLQDQSVILAFVDESYTEAEAKALQPQIERISNVASVDFIGKEEAMETYVDEYLEDESLAEDITPEIFRDRFSIHLEELESMTETAPNRGYCQSAGRRGSFQRVFDRQSDCCGGVHHINCGFAGGVAVYYVQHHQTDHL